MLHTPRLVAIKFTGDFKKKLFEIGARVLPILDKDDIVIVTELEARLLIRSPHFEKANIEEYFNLGEKKPENIEATKGIKEDVYTPPYIEDLEKLDDENIKRACDYFDIKIGNKKIETLKASLLPFLKNKEDVSN